jgi:hypothetical protein
LDTDYDNYLTIIPGTRKLYWDEKEIVVRNTIELVGLTRKLAQIGTLAAVLGAVGGLLNGFINLNKEICLVHFGSCNVVVALPSPPTQPLKPHSP